MQHHTYGLTFQALAEANAARQVVFKNRKGEDRNVRWTPAQWLQATLGELGELAHVRCQYDEGAIDFETLRVESGKELADVQIYLELAGKHMLDTVEHPSGSQDDWDHAQMLMLLVAALGSYANCRKKYEIGDYSKIQYVAYASQFLNKAKAILQDLDNLAADVPRSVTLDHHPDGLNLGLETEKKFNEVSRRINCPIRLDGNAMGWSDGYRIERDFSYEPPLERRK